MAFFGANFDFGKCFGVFLGPATELVCWLLYTTLFISVWSRNGSLLLQRKRGQFKMMIFFYLWSAHEAPTYWPFSPFQFSSVAQSCPTLCNPMDCSMSGFPVHHQLLKLTQTHVHWVGDAIKLSHPLSSPSPPTFNLSQHQCLFQWVSSSHEVAKYCSFSFNISPPNEYLGLIFFSIDWLDLLEFQETLKRLLQHHSLKASILQCSAFFMVQLSHLCMTTWKTIALTRWTFVGKVMSLLFNMLSGLVIAFLRRSVI